MTFKPSDYQLAIYNWVQNGRGDAVVQAVAGSGKTSTLIEAGKLLRSDRAIFLAFNRHIVKELQERLGNSMKVQTIHSVGVGCVRKALGKAVVDEGKYADIAKPYAEEIADDLKRNYAVELRRWMRSKKKDEDKEPEEPPSVFSVVAQLKKLAHFCRVTLTDPADFAAVEEMVAHFDCLEDGLELKQLHYPLTSILREGEKIADREGIIDYDDMLWLPNQWKLSPYPQDHVFVDECQDLSPAQLELVLKMRGRGGRMLFVGDPSQAIYGFSGADSDSIDNIIRRTKATVLPLSICYRCPCSHIELAQKIVPEIQPKQNALLGIVETIAYDKLPEMIAEGDLVISRCTAPAIKLCIELIAKRIPARVRGRDIGKSLTSIVKEIANRSDFDFSRFGDFLKEYQTIKVGKLQQKRNSEAQVQSLCDRLDGIQVCYQSFNSPTVEIFCREIEELFSDSRSSVVLSTVHRAKGLEEKRVFILRPDQLPLRWKNQQGWQEDQEENIRYIALTRAKEALYFVTKDEPKKDNDEVEDDEEDDDEENDDEDF